MNEKDQRLSQGIIPDIIIDAHGRINGGTFSDNLFDDRLRLHDHKILAGLKVTVEALAILVRNDLKSVPRSSIPLPWFYFRLRNRVS